MLAVLRYFLWTSLVLFALAVVGLNAKPVILDYYINTITLPLSFILVIQFAFGFLVGLGFNLINQFKIKALNNRLQYQNKQTEIEIKQFQTLLASAIENNQQTVTERSEPVHDEDN